MSKMSKMTELDEDITGTLENWVYGPVGGLVWGDIYGDVRNRWPDGTRIHTSGLVSTTNLHEGLVITTMYSTYLLGKPLEAP